LVTWYVKRTAVTFIAPDSSAAHRPVISAPRGPSFAHFRAATMVRKRIGHQIDAASARLLRGRKDKGLATP